MKTITIRKSLKGTIREKDRNVQAQASGLGRYHNMKKIQNAFTLEKKQNMFLCAKFNRKCTKVKRRQRKTSNANLKRLWYDVKSTKTLVIT